VARPTAREGPEHIRFLSHRVESEPEPELVGREQWALAGRAPSPERMMTPFRSPGAEWSAIAGILAGLLIWGLGAGGAAGGEGTLEERLARASPERGEQVFQVCRACHMIDEGAPHTIGPNLWGVVGRPVASAEGYDRYTPAMSALEGAWTPGRLDIYLRQPMVEVQGTTMAFPGVPDSGDRADLIAWLNRNSPAPLDLGAAGAAGQGAADTVSGGAAPAPVRDLGLLVPGEGALETHAYCTACHSERIVAQQGLMRDGWAELFEQMVEEHEMAPIEEPDRSRVLGYLATHYGIDRPNFPTR